MNIVLWVVQGLLAVVSAVHGRAMLFPQKPQTDWMPYIHAIPPALRRFIGLAEVLAALGLILPQLINIWLWLTPLAATGLVVIMLLAIGFHILRREYPNVVFNLVLLMMSAFVAYGRFVV